MNQLILEFELEHPELPREMDRLLVSYIKSAAQNVSEEFFQSLFDKSKSIIKPYTYSYNLPGARFVGEKILLSKNKFTMSFSDADLGQMIYFYNGFKMMRYKSYPMNQNSMTLRSLRVQKLSEIQDNEIIVKMQSSLVARRHNAETNQDRYYTYDESEFSAVLKENIDLFLEKMGWSISTDDFSITPIKGKKVVAYIFGRPTDTSIGIYKITGNPELLNILQQAGAGSRRSQGHGKFQVLG